MASFAPLRSDPTGADAAVGAERTVSFVVPEETVPGSDAAAAADVEPSAVNATVAAAASPRTMRRMRTAKRRGRVVSPPCPSERGRRRLPPGC